VGEQPLNPARIEAVLGYALAVAAQADHPRDRELGPIHLLKYLYLADLAHAETHGGESYSGVDSKTRLKKMREEVQRRLAKKREAQAERRVGPRSRCSVRETLHPITRAYRSRVERRMSPA
jgi:hypothetical protein